MEFDLSKLQINQNVLVLIVGLTGLGVAEYFNLYWLKFFTFYISLVMSLTVTISMSVYSWNYIKKNLISQDATSRLKAKKVEYTDEKIKFEYTYITDLVTYYTAVLAIIFSAFLLVSQSQSPDIFLVSLSGFLSVVIGITLCYSLFKQSELARKISNGYD